MTTPINPYLDELEEEISTPVSTKTVPPRAAQQPESPAPDEIINPYLEDDDEFETPPAPAPPRAARPKLSAPKTVSTDDNTVSKRFEKPSVAPQQSKNTAPRERPSEKIKLNIPALGADAERVSEVKTPEMTSAAPAKTTTTAPYQITKEYRDSLTPEQKEASKKKNEAKKQAKKDAYARGERPWETKKSKHSNTTVEPSGTPAGHKKRDPDKVYHRAKITKRDCEVFFFIARFRYTTTKIMAKVLGVKYITAFKRLRGLEEFGYIAGHNTGLGRIWTINQRALAALRDHRFEVPIRTAYRFDADSFDYNGMRHSLFIQWIAVQAVHGELSNQRAKGGFPKNIQWTQLIPENMMRAGRQVLGGNDKLREAKENDIREVLQGNTTWQELFETTPAHWILTGKKFNSTLKIPDMAVSFEHARKTDRPMSAAIEVELTRKPPQEYRDIFKAYGQDQHTYSGVIYVVDNETTGEVIKQAAQEVGFNRLQVLLILDENGEVLDSVLDLM